MTAPTNGQVLEQVRQALDDARAAGQPTPGRPTLVRLTGATDHAVRTALAELATEDTAAGDAGDGLATDPASAGEPAPGNAPMPASTGPTDNQVPLTAERDTEPAGDLLAARSPALATAGEPVAARSPGGGKLVAWAGFVFGSLVSIAANVLASRIAPAGAPADWQPSVYAEFGAAVWPLGLLLSVEALSRIRWPNGALWNLARFGGAGTVALGSAVISYSHIAAVLTSWGYSTVGAHVGPLVIDGLMTISGFALLATAGGRAGDGLAVSVASAGGKPSGNAPNPRPRGRSETAAPPAPHRAGAPLATAGGGLVADRQPGRQDAARAGGNGH